MAVNNQYSTKRFSYAYAVVFLFIAMLAAVFILNLRGVRHASAEKSVRQYRGGGKAESVAVDIKSAWATAIAENGSLNESALEALFKASAAEASSDELHDVSEDDINVTFSGSTFGLMGELDELTYIDEPYDPHKGLVAQVSNAYVEIKSVRQGDDREAGNNDHTKSHFVFSSRAIPATQFSVLDMTSTGSSIIDGESVYSTVKNIHSNKNIEFTGAPIIVENNITTAGDISSDEEHLFLEKAERYLTSSSADEGWRAQNKLENSGQVHTQWDTDSKLHGSTSLDAMLESPTVGDGEQQRATKLCYQADLYCQVDIDSGTINVTMPINSTIITPTTIESALSIKTSDELDDSAVTLVVLDYSQLPTSIESIQLNFNDDDNVILVVSKAEILTHPGVRSFSTNTDLAINGNFNSTGMAASLISPTIYSINEDAF